MSRLWRQLAIATNWPVLLSVIVLTAIGIVSIGAHAASDPQSADDARKQMIFALLGIGLMFGMQAFNYLTIGRFAWGFYVLSFALLIYTVAPGVPQGSGFLAVPEVKGQRNWINCGPIKLQPAEMMKVAFCMVMARYLRYRSNYRTLGGLVPPFLLAVAPLVVILKQPDLGTAMVFVPALFVMLFVAGARAKHLLAIVAFGLALCPIVWFAGAKEKTGMERDYPVLRNMPALVKKYQRARVHAMFSNDPGVLRDAGYQQDRAATAFGSGGLTGKGAMNIPVGRTVPEAHNDMIFALIGEQFGFMGAAILLAAYLVLFASGIEIASATREPFGKLLAIGIVSILAGQAFVNLMVALRLMPVTGITLPFVSYGGSSLLASCMSAGLLLNIGQNRPIVMANNAFEFD